jgi:pimeloyl-ACP methyl ester carboxylesterase
MGGTPVTTIEADGIETYVEIRGEGPPLLLFSPGGFNAVVENWSSLGVYRDMQLIEQLAASYTCILFDKRESGRSGGRVERLMWTDYVRHALALLDALGHGRAHLMGGCVGCSAATAVATDAPERVASMVLYSPAGGAHYRLGQHDRFHRHLAFVRTHGLDAVVERARSRQQPFNKDPEVGPWGSVIAREPGFADRFAAADVDRYVTLVNGMARTLFDRDTVPGPEPEDLISCDIPALIVPGQDRSHAPSAAHFLHECLPASQMWDVPVSAQTAQTAPERILRFLAEHPV